MARTATFDDLGAHVTWSVRENCTWSRSFVAKSNDVPVNIAGYTITAEVTASESSDTAVKTFVCTITDAAAGKFTISVSAADATLTPGRYWWSLQWNTGSVDTPLCSGPFIVSDWTL